MDWEPWEGHSQAPAGATALAAGMSETRVLAIMKRSVMQCMVDKLVVV